MKTADAFVFWIRLLNKKDKSDKNNVRKNDENYIRKNGKKCAIYMCSTYTFEIYTFVIYTFVATNLKALRSFSAKIWVPLILL